MLHLALKAFTGLLSNCGGLDGLSGVKVFVTFMVISDPSAPPALSPRGVTTAVLTFEQSLRSICRPDPGPCSLERQPFPNPFNHKQMMLDEC
jgi:hypothetical protein